MLWINMNDEYAQMSMGMTAENLADKYDLTREDCDIYALKSQSRWNDGNFYVFL